MKIIVFTALLAASWVCSAQAQTQMQGIPEPSEHQMFTLPTAACQTKEEVLQLADAERTRGHDAMERIYEGFSKTRACRRGTVSVEVLGIERSPTVLRGIPATQVMVHGIVHAIDSRAMTQPLPEAYIVFFGVEVTQPGPAPSAGNETKL